MTEITNIRKIIENNMLFTPKRDQYIDIIRETCPNLMKKHERSKTVDLFTEYFILCKQLGVVPCYQASADRWVSICNPSGPYASFYDRLKRVCITTNWDKVPAHLQKIHWNLI